MGIRTFDPKKTKAVYGPISLGDWAKGTFIKASQDGDDFTLEKGADGTYDRINNNNNLWTVEVTIKQTSPINDLLSAARIADKAGNTGPFPLVVKDMSQANSLTVLTLTAAHIKKSPDLSLADTLQPRTWVFEGVGECVIGGNT